MKSTFIYVYTKFLKYENIYAQRSFLVKCTTSIYNL